MPEWSYTSRLIVEVNGRKTNVSIYPFRENEAMYYVPGTGVLGVKESPILALDTAVKEIMRLEETG